MPNLSFIGILFCYFNLNLISTALEANPSVPVIIWDLQKPPLEIPAAFSVSLPYFLKYLKAFASDNILFFQQDNLSVEDLSSHADTFKHVRNSLRNHHSLYFPAVEFKKNILPHSLSAHGYKTTYLEPGSAVGELKLDPNNKNIVVVELPSTSTNPSRKNALQKTDEIIGNVLSKVGQKANFTIILTGKEPSVKRDYVVERRRIARSLDQTLPIHLSRNGFHQSKCVLMFLWKDIEVFKGNSSFTLFNNKTQLDIGNCPGEESNLIIKYTDLENGKVSLRFNFIKNFYDHWKLKYAELIEKNDKGIILTPNWLMEYVPRNKSYVCSKRLVMKSNDSYSLVLERVQMEAFTDTARVFSPSWDCVGFFTIPIWMGLLTGILFITILLVGMFMLSEVKTMDRFDDPKGKHIMVTGTNE